MAKFAEKLIILKEVGGSILQRLSFTKKVCSSPTQKPAFLSDVQFAKVNAALLKKFPEFDPSAEKVDFDIVLTLIRYRPLDMSF
jgi:hypothetical protein